MANPTTNYGFVLPTSSDLVTDLPADFDVALQGVDTQLKALQPGTTLGDLAYSSATANTNTRLGIGSTGQVLTVSAGVPAWSSPAPSVSMTSIASGDLPTGSGTLSLTSISSSYTHLQLVVYAWNGSGNNNLQARINGDTGSNYATYNTGSTGTTSRQNGYINETSIKLSYGDAALSGNNKNITVMDFPFYTNATTGKTYSAITGFLGSDSNRAFIKADGYYYGTNAAITQLDFFYGSNWSGGTYVLYGVN